jgi:hypothetical protein
MMNDKSLPAATETTCEVCGAIHRIPPPKISVPDNLNAYLIKYSGNFNVLSDAIINLSGYVYIPADQNGETAITVLPSGIFLTNGQVFSQGDNNCLLIRVTPLSPP